MALPGSCTRCSDPLVVESDDGLCPTCRSVGGTPRSPGGASAPAADPHTDTFRPAGLETASFDRREAPTRSFPPPGQQESTETGPGPPPRLPSAPPGYALIRKLGEGAMGEVYLARDLTAERDVALKFLRSAGERALVEIRALARLEHPHVVRVLGHDFFWATPYLVMEFAAGGTLGQLAKRDRPVPPGDAVALIAAAARALHAAHEAGILHRDVKPSNIFLAADGTVRVGDFGLAKRTDRDDGLTVGSGPLGTVEYMPPEQTRRGDVDRRADVYGLGATLYFLITGRPPFSRFDPDVLARIASTPPERPRATRPEIPLGIEAVVMKCLEKNPADRYPTAAALAGELEACAAGREPGAPRLTRWRRLRRWVAWHRTRFAAAGLAGAALAGAYVIGVAGSRPPVAKPTDPQDALRAELRAGRKVHVLSAQGAPDWLKENWLIHPVPLGSSVTAGGACAFENLRPALLAFMTDPGIESYNVSAELRILRSELADPTKPPTVAEFARTGVGLFLGHVRSAAGGAEAHTFLVVEFTDHLPPEVRAVGVTRADAQAALGLLVAQPDTPLAEWSYSWSAPVRFAPAEREPGEWRQVLAEVRPSGVKLFWATTPGGTPEPLLDLKADEIPGRYAAARGWLDKYRPGVGLEVPAWRPRAPFGVWSSRAAVAVRNVTVEPIP